MARTLGQLKQSVDKLIDELGEDSPVAAFIFNRNDVFKNDDEGNPIPYPLHIAEQVLDEIEGFDYIYEQVFECIDDELRRLKVSGKIL